MHRALTRKRLMLSDLAEPAGRFIGSLMRTVPGLGGALIVCFGLGMAWKPLGFIAAGLFLLVIDRRSP